MKKKWIICLIVCLIGFYSALPVSAGTIQDRMMSNQGQDVVFAGKVSHVSKHYIVLKVTDYINVQLSDTSIEKREKNHRYVIPRKKEISYQWSYHGKKMMEEGDCIVASLKKEKGKWVIANGLYETDTDHYNTLSFAPFQKNQDFQKTKLKYFINSDGRMKKFTVNKNATRFYYKGRKIYDIRWNIKKYLTIEQICNTEKLKTMDQDNHLPTETDLTGKIIYNTKRILLFMLDFLAIVALVAILRKRSKRKKSQC